MGGWTGRDEWRGERECSTVAREGGIEVEWSEEREGS